MQHSPSYKEKAIPVFIISLFSPLLLANYSKAGSWSSYNETPLIAIKSGLMPNYYKSDTNPTLSNSLVGIKAK